MGIELVKTTGSIAITKNAVNVEVAAPEKADIEDIYNKGINAGYESGVDTGYSNGYSEGKEAGMDEGFNNGFSSGYASGYEFGYSTGEKAGNEKGYTNGLNAGYENGYSEGKEAGKADGIEEGRAAAESDFWDKFQDGGKRNGYYYAFAEYTDFDYWSKGFTPKYPLDFSNTALYNAGAFYYFGAKAKKPINFNEFVANNNIQFKLTSYSGAYKNCMVVGENTFYGSYFSHLPRLYAGQLRSTFWGCRELITIDYISFGTTSSNGHSSPFASCSKLENITFGGENKGNGLNFSPCPKLTVESILSLFNCLYDYSGTTTKRSLTLGATNLAKLTDAQKAIATDKGWTLA